MVRWLGGEWVWMGGKGGWLGFCGGYELPYTLLYRVGAGFDFLVLGYRSAGRLGLWVWECFAFKEGLFIVVALFSHLFKLLRSDHEFIFLMQVIRVFRGCAGVGMGRGVKRRYRAVSSVLVIHSGVTGAAVISWWRTAGFFGKAGM